MLKKPLAGVRLLQHRDIGDLPDLGRRALGRKVDILFRAVSSRLIEALERPALIRWSMYSFNLFISKGCLSKWFSFISVVVIIGLAGCESITVRTNLGRNFDKAGIGEEPVAVVPDQPSKAGDLFADLVSNELLGLGFRIIERIHLETILREQQLSLTGLLERQDYGQIGKLANIRRLFVVSALFSPNFGNVANATIRLIDLKTGEVLMSTTYGDPNANIYPPQNTKTESVKKIADSIAENIGSGGSRP